MTTAPQSMNEVERAAQGLRTAMSNLESFRAEMARLDEVEAKLQSAVDLAVQSGNLDDAGLVNEAATSEIKLRMLGTRRQQVAKDGLAARTAIHVALVQFRGILRVEIETAQAGLLGEVITVLEKSGLDLVDAPAAARALLPLTGRGIELGRLKETIELLGDALADVERQNDCANVLLTLSENLRGLTPAAPKGKAP